MLAMYVASKEAMDRAEKENELESNNLGIEAFTYRMGPHTTSDDPSIYFLEPIVNLLIKYVLNLAIGSFFAHSFSSSLVL